MKILVTGAKGFIGKNIIAELKAMNNYEILEVDLETSDDLLDHYTKEAQFIFHFAGINRPLDPKEFSIGNRDFTAKLTSLLKKNHNRCPVLMSSSAQADLDNDYGKSKKEAEEKLRNFGKDNGSKVLIYRLPNVFGKWSRPNYNSAIATFCHNISRDLPITISNRDHSLTLAYIDDVIQEFIRSLKGQETRSGEDYIIPVTHQATLGEIVDLLNSFQLSRKDLSIPYFNNELAKKLYSTYLSFLPEDHFSYNLKMNIDARGSFTEFLRLNERGQVSVNISKPGITKGNHWHHTKVEKFLVVSGKAIIRFRHALGGEIKEYIVSSEKLEVVDIPAGYTHNIENIGSTDLVTIMWANEPFNPEKPDTYFLGV